MSSTRSPVRPRTSSAARPSVHPAGTVRTPKPTKPPRQPQKSLARFAQRRRAGRRRRWIRVLVAVLLVGALATAGWAVYFSRWFAVTSVVITGTHRVSAERVREAAQVPIGRPIVRVDTAAIRRHVEGISQLASVTVTTQWPNTVRIVVVERTPAAVVGLLGGGYRILDRDGVTLGEVPDRPAGLPLLTMDVTTADPAALQAAATVASSLSPALAAKVRTVSAVTANSVVIVLKSGSIVRWGDSSQGAIKAEVLAALMKRGAVVYDVSAPYAPTTAKTVTP